MSLQTPSSGVVDSHRTPPTQPIDSVSSKDRSTPPATPNMLVVDFEEETLKSYTPCCGGESFQVQDTLRRAWYCTRVFFSLSVKDAGRRKVSFCLGMLSVFVVVFVAAVLITALNNLPVVFLQLGQASEGAIDVILTPGSVVSDASSLNYSYISALFSNGRHSYHSPRMTPSPLRVWGGAACDDLNWTSCSNVDACVSQFCPRAGRETVFSVFIDAERERRMEVGAAWPLIPDDGVIIDAITAGVNNVSVGGLLYVAGDFAEPFREAVQATGVSHAESIVAVRVTAIESSTKRKFPSSITRFVALPFGAASSLVGSGLLGTSASHRSAFSSIPPQWMAGSVIVNLPPASRVQTFIDNEFVGVRRVMIAFLAELTTGLGFNQVSPALPLLQFMETNQYFSLFLGLIISIIIVVLAFLSIMLIYSLLTVNVESRVYELGVMRMVGFARVHLMGLVATNALLFTLPAYVAGLIVAEAVFVGMNSFFFSILGVRLPYLISAEAVGYATAAGLGIPMVASLAPMWWVMTHDLASALCTSRGRNDAVVVRIDRDTDSYLSATWTTFGVVFSAFGLTIYYLFPLSIVNLNFGLLFYIFFGVLLSMLAGFTLLMTNGEGLMQKIVSYVLLWWEYKAVFNLLRTNLIAHRLRNRKVTLMYAITLSFVIFITVAFDIQLTSFQFQQERRFGSEARISGTLTFGETRLVDVELSRLKAAGSIRDYTWRSTSPKFRGSRNIITNMSVQTIGRYVDLDANPVATAPNFFDVTKGKFLTIDGSVDHSLSLGELLYSADGAGVAFLPSMVRTSMNLDLDDSFVLSLRSDKSSRIEVLRAGAFLSSASALTVTSFVTRSRQDYILSLPMLMLRAGSMTSIRQMAFDYVGMRGDKATMGGVAVALQSFMSEKRIHGSVELLEDETSQLSQASNILRFFFLFTQIVASVICFFALVSSMSTNILYQSKEIGVLRSIGVGRFRIYRLFIEEALILVTAASILGLVVGLIVAYTLLAQNTIFTRLPLPLLFPWLSLAVLVGLSVVFALLASYGPTSTLLNLPSVTALLRYSV